MESSDRRNLMIMLGVLGALYGALITNHWSSGPDTAYYLGIARSLMMGHGFEFNGAPVGKAPPGWPFVLALLMRISRSFAFLEAVNTVFLLYSAGCGYFILRRLLDPRKALYASLLSGVLYWTYTSGLHLRTEALFTAILMQTTLWSLQMAEGKRRRLAPILLGCALLATVRYAGIAAWVVPAAAMMHGLALKRNLKPDEYDRILSGVGKVGISLCVMLLSFVGTREVLMKGYLAKQYTPRPMPVSTSLGIRDMDIADKEEGAAPAMQDVFGSIPYFSRSLSAGQWISSFFWMPAQAAFSNETLSLGINLFGWMIILCMIPPAWRSARSGNYLVAAAMLYSMAIIARWGSINSRYFMPVSPLLVAGAWLAFENLVRSKPRFSRAVLATFIGAVAITNLALWSVDLFICRSGERFYHYAEGGELEELVSATHYLKSRDVKDGEVATNHYIVSLKRRRTNGYCLRGMYLLLDRVICVVPNTVPEQALLPKKRPKAKSQPSTQMNDIPPENWDLNRWEWVLGEGKPSNPNVALFCKVRGIRFYLYRPPEGAKAWHFRQSSLPAFLGGKNAKTPADWELYELVDEKLVQVQFPRGINWPTEVP